MLLYKNIKPLSRDYHRKLRLRPVENYGFAADTHWSPVAGVEFRQASLNYPIVFVGEGEEGRTVTPIVLLGLIPGRNEQIGPDREWKANRYIPAYMRRYPFIFSRAEDNPEQLIVSFDADFEGFGGEEGGYLFNEDGSPARLLQDAVNLLTGFNAELQRTSAFVTMLLKYDLLVERTIAAQGRDGEIFDVPGFRVIDRQRFSGLDADALAEFHQNGFLGWIFAHHMSLGSLSALLEKTVGGDVTL